MIDDLYVKFFPRDIEDISFIANRILENIPEDEYYKKFNEYMRLQEVELRSIISSKEELDRPRFGAFLKGMLLELYAAIDSHNSLHNSLDKKLSDVSLVLKQFNIKCLAGLKTKFYDEFPSHFENHTTYKTSPVGFKKDAKIEKTETFRYSYLIAKGVVWYDSYNFYYKSKIFTSASSLSNEIGINRNYLIDTMNQSKQHNNKNIFSPSRLKTQDYLVSKMRSEGDSQVEF